MIWQRFESDNIYEFQFTGADIKYKHDDWNFNLHVKVFNLPPTVDPETKRGKLKFCDSETMNGKLKF